MARAKGSAKFSGNLEVAAGGALDARSVAPTKADLTVASNYPYSYVGMLVSVQDEGKLYMLVAKPTTTLANWVEVGTGGSGEDNIVEGYYNSLDHLFYEESTFVTPIAGKNKTLYIDLVSNYSYRFSGTIFVRIDEEYGPAYVVEGYRNDSDGLFYREAAFTTPITGVTGVIYVALNENLTYRFAGAQFTRLDKEEPELVFGYYNNADELMYEEAAFTNAITGDTSKIYVALNVNKTYRYTGVAFVRLDEEYDHNVVEGYFYNNEFYVEDTHETQFNHSHNRLYIDRDTDKIYRWDNGYICVNEGQVVQYTTLPSPTADNVSKIVQYVGETTSTAPIYTNGYFYKCVEDSSTTPSTYKWEVVQVQEGGAGGGTIENAMTASVNVGGITIGKAYPAGTSMEQMWQDLIDPIQYPTFTNPSATLSVPGDKILETGSSVSKTFTLSFNQGTINPAYGTSGKRSGAADTYALNGGTAQSTNTFTETVSSSNKTFQGTVTYLAGEQPKDSKGNNYNSPLPAGSVNSNTITYEFVDAIWANTSNITTVAKLGLVSKSAKVKEFTFPAQTVANPEEFHVPASWTVTAVEVLNTLSNQWESCVSEFTVGTTTHNDAAGTSVNYATYTDNRGYAAASRKVRVKWS